MARFVLLLLAVMCSSAVAFTPPAAVSIARPVMTRAAPTTLSMSDMGAEDPNDSSSEDVIAVVPLALKFAGIIAIKTAKDVVNYPPKMMEQVFNSKTNGLEQMSPLVMLFKLMGVLVFKVGHDMVYFPALWASRLLECQSLDECEL